MKLFDAHNHIHLGPYGITPLLDCLQSQHSLQTISSSQANIEASTMTSSAVTFAGAAIMSTHPRDYSLVESVTSELNQRSYQAVSCYGIHPWFLNDVLSDIKSTRKLENGETHWIRELRYRLTSNPNSIVGEIGLDGARWVVQDNQRNMYSKNKSSYNFNSDCENYDTTVKCERRLACPMELQQKAFEQQLLLATEMGRPVSIHVVRAWRELFDSLSVVIETMRQKYQEEDSHGILESGGIHEKRSAKTSKTKSKRILLPPKIYFHAFSGKAGIIPSLLCACAKGNLNPKSDIFFGFAPAISNFYAPKTPSVIKTIGIHQILLETDLEDSSCVWADLKLCLETVAKALNLPVQDVADLTYNNAKHFYFGFISET